VKLLFDQNLSPRLVPILVGLYPAYIHVRDLGLERSDDRIIWDYALAEGYTIVTRDADFHQMSFVYGHPPKVVWIQRGNCSTDDIADILEVRFSDISAFATETESAFLALK
jgi:predicted nuclease of predicted toxin-antitoxin system